MSLFNNRFDKWIMVFILSGMLLCAGYVWGEDTKPSDSVLAVIGSRTITVENLRSEINRRRQAVSGGFSNAGQIEKLLGEMVRFEVIAENARLAGYEKDPEIQKRFRQLLARKFEEDNLGTLIRGLTVTDEEIKTYYDSHLEDFSVPRMAKAAMIYIKVSPLDPEEKKLSLRKRAEKALAEAGKQDPATIGFGALPIKFSDDQPTRYRRGEIGWLSADRKDAKWDNAVADAVFSLAMPGDISPVITTPEGFYIVKLMDAKPGGIKSFDSVKAEVRYRVLNSKKQKLSSEFYNKMTANVHVDINRDILRSIEEKEIEAVKNKSGQGAGPPRLPGS